MEAIVSRVDEVLADVEHLVHDSDTDVDQYNIHFGYIQPHETLRYYLAQELNHRFPGANIGFWNGPNYDTIAIELTP
jgi:hypothetical protein